MADIPISSLPVASALSGPELLAVVQSGSTKQSTVTAVYDFIFSQASGPAVGSTLVKRDSFGTIASLGLYANDDGFGTGGFLQTAHQATIGGHCTVADYLEVGGNVLNLNHPDARLEWPNSGSGFYFKPDSGHTRLEMNGNFRFNDGISFGTYTASTGVITGSISVTDKTGTTVHLMAFL